MGKNESDQTNNLEDRHAKAEAAYQAGNIHDMIGILSGANERAELQKKQEEEEQRKLENDWEMVNAVFQTQGPSAAVRALQHLRGGDTKVVISSAQPPPNVHVEVAIEPGSYEAGLISQSYDLDALERHVKEVLTAAKAYAGDDPKKMDEFVEASHRGEILKPK